MDLPLLLAMNVPEWANQKVATLFSDFECKFTDLLLFSLASDSVRLVVSKVNDPVELTL